jgi:hypothetical protein
MLFVSFVVMNEDGFSHEGHENVKAIWEENLRY